MSLSRCLIVVTHYCPLVGGGQSVYDAMARSNPENFHVLTGKRDYATGEYVAGHEAFDKAAPYKITRMDRVRPDLAVKKIGMIERILGYFRSKKIERQLVRRILAICEVEAIDTICIGAAEAFTWLPATLKKQTDRKLIYYTHGEEFSQTAHSVRAEKQRVQALKHADGIICVSRFTADLLTKKYAAHPGKIKLIHNGVDFDKFSTPSSLNFRQKHKVPDGKIVAATGRMVARKGFDKLVQAWPKVIAEEKSALLFLAGSGPLSETLSAAIDREGLSNSVHQLGFIADDTLISLYQAADIFIMPNRTLPNGDTEGFGLVFLEAAAAGTPSIGGKAGGAVDAILDGETGLLIDGENTDAIAQAIVDLLKDSKRRQALADAARKHAEKNDWGSKARELLAFFDELRLPAS